ncbi:MAG: TetR family transcriptional regulator [Parvibaculum sp.]|uniref:TetR/AcrR family transcriptional regulator n=1 Tax=Parvibaculum sp. TaxID=2024848 RepID=UPI0025E3E5A7|nr:TetR family transcriptional regulator [Parvibaculum sp.]MCE9650925.1 TetR family transcriptional regulator [Parvibaculum sp.]
MKLKETTTRTPRSDTRLRLILAAEKLFGEQGVHGVTLKEINAAAGQRNESALHYHFGSKPALVEAILLHRARDIDTVRGEFVEALLRDGKEKDIRVLLRATFMPLVGLVAEEDGVRFVRFLAQVLNDPDFDLPTLALRGDLPSVNRANALIVAALGDLPPEIAIQRQRFLVEMAISSLAIWTRQHDAVNEIATRELFIANLFDSMYGFLTAPVSEEALEALKRTVRKKEKK